MTEKETPEQELARLKANQAAAHKRWRESEKGKAYYQRLKEKRAFATPTVTVKLCRDCTDETCKKSGCIAA